MDLELLDVKKIISEEMPEPEWMIPDLFLKGSMILLCGAPGVGKSYMAYTMAMAIATGSPFLGRHVQPGRVLYVDEENSLADVKYYLSWAWRALGKPDMDLVENNLKFMHFQLVRNPTHWASILHLQCLQHQPVMTFIDTVTPACMIKEENDNGEASQATQKLRRAQHASPGSSMLLLKHLKDMGKGKVDVRGAKFWKGTVDSIIYHRRGPGKPRRDGLYMTRLEPEKKRAFGLGHAIDIDPEKTPDGAIILHAKDSK